jgi:hypothetical protein
MTRELEINFVGPIEKDSSYYSIDKVGTGCSLREK